MSLFKKNRDAVEIIDFTALQKRGILEKVAAKEKKAEGNSPPSLPFPISSPSPPSPSPSLLSNQGESIFGALDSLASISSNQANTQANNSSEQETSSLKIKIEDLEYRLERLLERLSFIESKIK